MQEITFNILDRPDLDPRIAAFIDKAIGKIEEEAVDKNLLFFSETNHDVMGNFTFMFCCKTLHALQRLGVKHIMTERGDKSRKVLNDAVVNGQISPSQYADILSSSVKSTSPPEVVQAYNLCLAEGLITAASLGIQIHCINGYEGVVPAHNQTKYFYQLSRKNRQWLAYTTENSRFFSDPSALLEELVDQDRKRNPKQKIGLEEAIRHYRSMSTQQLIFFAWQQVHVGKGFQDVSKLVSLRKVQQVFESKSDAEIESILVDRKKNDGAVMGYANELRAGEKTAFFYGAAHIRHQRGGFTDNISPEEYTVFQLIFEVNPQLVFEKQNDPTGCTLSTN